MKTNASATFVHYIKQVPVALTIGIFALLIAFVPSANEFLLYDRSRIEAGEIWRFASGHFTHWNAEHLQWDLLMFVVLGVICELRNPRRMHLCVVAAAANVSALVHWMFPDVATYRGLSGIDTALFTMLAMDLMREAWNERRKTLSFLVGVLFLGFIAKTAYEAVTGHALFVDQQLAGFELLVWDHIVAGAVGAILAICSTVSPTVRNPLRRNMLVSSPAPSSIAEVKQIA